MADSPPHLNAVRYVDGRFAPFRDPLNDVPQTPESDMLSDLKKLGYEEFFTVGSDTSPMSICTYRKATESGYTYMISVWDTNMGGPSVYVDDYVTFMDLVARWSTIVQSAVVAELVRDLSSGDFISHHGMVERIAARAAYGATTGLELIQVDEANARRYRQQQKK